MGESMKVILFMAQSINGMIARENYDEDFLSNKNWNVFATLAEHIGCFIVGRKTYEEVNKWKEYNFESIHSKKIIVSKNKKYTLLPDFILAQSPEDALDKAAALGFKKVILCGGGTLNSAFMKAGLVDEILLNIEPYVLGRGIRIVSEETFEERLQLLSYKKLTSGIVRLHYKMKR